MSQNNGMELLETNKILNTRMFIKIKITRVRGITCSASARHGKDVGSMLGRGTVVLVPDARNSALVLKARPRCLAQAVS